MVQALSYTPEWLARPSPGSKVFQPPQAANIGSVDASIPIAYRGTEVFAAVQGEIRWTDLVYLQELAEIEKNGYKRTTGFDANHPRQPYRTLKVPVSRSIRRLTVSPNGELLVIVTDFTVHVAILPDSNHLGVPGETAPTRLKTFQLGPTDHVVDRAPVASALWHPLGVGGNCLVTVTTDAIVRIWELDISNRHAFDKAATAIDLKRLGNASLAAEDMSPSRFTGRQFSPDDFELEVASATFGGQGKDSETCWSPLTLWIVMRNGDLYSMCPLLPSKWSPSPALIDSLLATIALKHEDQSLQAKDTASFQRQLQWAAELDQQVQNRPDESASLLRPLKTPSIPMLQGPLNITPDADNVFDAADIFVVSGCDPINLSDLDTQELEDNESLSSPLNTILVSASDGTVHILLDLEGVEARWLPSKGPKFTSPFKRQLHRPELLLVESLTICKPGKNDGDAKICFTADVVDPNAVFASHIGGVTHLDLSSWTTKLGDELKDTDAGTDFRLGLFAENAKTHAHELIHKPVPKPRKTKQHDLYDAADPYGDGADAAAQAPQKLVVPCINIQDSDLGHFLLTTINGLPHAATLDDPRNQSLNASSNNSLYAPDDDDQQELQYEALERASRDIYAPPSAFWADTSLPSIPNEPRHARIRRTLTQKNQPISPATLELLIDIHRTLSTETDALNEAAAELFRRCNLLRSELQDQIDKGVDLANRIENVIDEDADDYPRKITLGDAPTVADVGINASVDNRMSAVAQRQKDLVARYHALKQKQSRIAGRPLSEKEKSWSRSIRELERAVLGPEDETETATADDKSSPHYRFAEVMAQKNELVRRAKAHLEAVRAASAGSGVKVEDDEGDDVSDAMSGLQINVSPERRAQRTGQIENLLERESALIEATVEKARMLGEWGLPAGV